VTGLPFAGTPLVSIVLPALDPTLGGQLALLELERAAFEAELGAPVAFTASNPGRGARWLLLLEPERTAPPATGWEPVERTIVSRGRDVGGLFEALNLWRTARRAGSAESVDCTSVDEAVHRVAAEVADTYPAFELRGLDWDDICARHADGVRRAAAPLPALQAWLAELEDSHTWVWPGHGNLPYVLEVGERTIRFVHVPDGSAGHEAGMRPGWRLLGLDEASPDGREWLARTAAPPHSRPYLAGRRLLAGPSGLPRALTAASPDGVEVTWEDTPIPSPPEPVVEWRRLGSGAAYLRIAAWLEGRDDEIDAALADLRGTETLILDLRRNPGGNLVLATRTRDRFLRARTTLGSIRYSVGGGGLSGSIPLVAEPPEERVRWPGRLVVLTDELTFSSSEDFLLGLQGLEHVTVVGAPSGGGSGRPRSLRLLPGTTLTVSTALTYDRAGRCVEGAGIPVDVPVADRGEVLEAAERL
jgi:carboxyl-terminal processing protease